MQNLMITAKEINNDHVVLTLNGVLNASSFGDLERALNELYEKGKYRVIIDMAGVSYISSAGVGVFIGAQPVAQENGGNLVLMRPASGVQDVFDLLGINEVCAVVADYDNAKIRLNEVMDNESGFE